MKGLIAFACCAAIATAALVGPAGAGAGVVDSYCSPSGDYCTAVLKKHGRIKLEIRTFSFDRYELCVRGEGAKLCKARRLHHTGGGLLVDRVDVVRKLIRLPGRYWATWRFSGSRLGPRLDYRLR